MISFESISGIFQLVKHQSLLELLVEILFDIYIYMPFKRSYRKRKPRTYRKRRGNVATRAIRMAKRALIQSKPEVKFSSFGLAGSFPATVTWTFNLINGLALSTDNTGRIGRQVLNKGCSMNINFKLPAGSANTNVRIIMFIDKMPNGTLATSADLFQVPNNLQSYLNPEFFGRFRMIMSKRVSLVLDHRPSFNFKKYIRFRCKTQYDSSSTGTIADLKTNAIYFGLVSDYVGATPPLISIQFRYTFTDA